MFKGEYAKRLISEQGRTLEWVARQCGIEYRTLVHYLNGHGNPALPVIKLMAIHLGVPEHTLDPDLALKQTEAIRVAQSK
jgi:transcriptional regulator with XRE-family HTH domain